MFRLLPEPTGFNGNIGIYTVQPELLLGDGLRFQKFTPYRLESHPQVYRRRFLFIHGMEYHSPSEVMRDLVEPFLENSGFASQPDFDQTELLFFYWPSCIAAHKTNAFQSAKPNMVRKLLTTVEQGWSQGLRERMDDASTRLCQALHATGILDRLGQTTLITHSLGATVWAMAAKKILEHTSRPNLGDWISLQPALNADAFCASEPFAGVADCYAHHCRPIAVLFSKWDLVLRSIYRLSAGKAAMGEVGAYATSVHSMDVSALVGEAHGTFRLWRRSGCFFRRSAAVIEQQMRQIRLRQDLQIAS